MRRIEPEERFASRHAYRDDAHGRLRAAVTGALERLMEAAY